MGLSKQVRASLVCLGAATALVGCSLSPSSLTTGSLFGSDSAPKVATAVVAPETPADRALHVGATTARAQRCGYVFDPQGTRAAYLAYEAQRGTTGEVLAKTEKSYDYTVASIGKNISGNATTAMTSRRRSSSVIWGKCWLEIFRLRPRRPIP